VPVRILARSGGAESGVRELATTRPARCRARRRGALLAGCWRADLDPPVRGGCWFWSSSRARSRAFAPLRGTSHFLLLVQEKVTKEKDTPVSRSRASIEVEASSHPWSSNLPAHPCAGARRGEAVLRLIPPRPCAARHDRAGANSHIHVLEHARLAPGPGSAARREPNGDPKSEEQQQQHAVASLGVRRAQRCRWAKNEARAAAGNIEVSFGSTALESPSFPPSSAGIRRGKARMSEAMDGRGRPLRGYAFASLGRAGRRIPSNAGNPARSLRGAGNPGCPFSWLLLFGQAKRSDSCPGGARTPLILISKANTTRPAKADQDPPSCSRLAGDSDAPAMARQAYPAVECRWRMKKPASRKP